jgi:hypothetical protein
MLLGQSGEVKKRVAPLVKAFAGGTKASLLDFGELMNSADVPRALFPLNPGRVGSPSSDFHCYAFLYGVMEAKTKGKIDREQFEEAFRWSLERPWSCIGALGEAGSVFFLKMDRAGFVKDPPPEVLRGRPQWYAPFLSAVLRHWPDFAAEAQRFTPAPLGSPREFTRVAYTIAQVLGHMGVVKTSTDVDTSAKVLHAVRKALAQPQNQA